MPRHRQRPTTVVQMHVEKIEGRGGEGAAADTPAGGLMDSIIPLQTAQAFTNECHILGKHDHAIRNMTRSKDV